jgi:hypothetical protein
MNEFAVDIIPGKVCINIDYTTFIEQPLEVLTSNLVANEWVWDGGNIALARSLTAQTIGENVRELTLRWLTTGLRAIRADEFAQLAELSEEWPKAWRMSAGSRIFFAGTVYEVRFSQHTEMHVYAARYDREIEDWMFGCESFDGELLPGDRFACLISSPEQMQLPHVLSWKRTFDRRLAYSSYDRPERVRQHYGW